MGAYSLNSVMGAVPVVAAMLGDQLGIKVAFGDFDTASTDGKTIHLPFTKKVNVLWGYTVHEAAHIKYTDFKAWDGIKSPLLRKFVNIIEDCRIEFLIVEPYPGLHPDLVALNDHLIDLGHYKTVPGDKDPIDALFWATMYWGYSQACGYTGFPLAETLDVFERVISKPARIKLGGLLSTITTLKDTTGSIALAEEIIKMAKEEFDKKQQQQPKSNPPQGAQGEGQAKPDQQSPGQQPNGSAKGDEGKGNADANGKGDAKDGESSAGDSSASQPQDGTGKPSAFDQLFGSKNPDDLPDGSGELAMSSMKGDEDKQLRQQVGSLGNTIKQKTPDISTLKSSDDDFDRAKALSNRLQAQLATALQAKNMCERSYSRHSGRLDARRIPGFIQNGDDRVFARRKDMGKSINTAVHILVDFSSSMSSPAGSQTQSMMQVASDAALAIAMSLSSIRGCNPAVSFFTTDDDNPLSYGIRHGQSWREAKRFPTKGSQSTPTAEALQQAVYELAKVKADRHILLLLTDGDPNNLSMTKEMAKRIEKSGEIELVGVGICSDAVKRFCTDHIVIHEPNDLLGTLFQVIKNKLAA